MQAVLWDEQKGAWFDYDLENMKKNLEFYPSNLAPLWAGCFSDPGVVDKAVKYLEVRGQWAAVAPGVGPSWLSRGPGRTSCACYLLWPPEGSREPRREGPGRALLVS